MFLLSLTTSYPHLLPRADMGETQRWMARSLSTLQRRKRSVGMTEYQFPSSTHLKPYCARAHTDLKNNAFSRIVLRWDDSIADEAQCSESMKLGGWLRQCRKNARLKGIFEFQNRGLMSPPSLDNRPIKHSWVPVSTSVAEFVWLTLKAVRYSIRGCSETDFCTWPHRLTASAVTQQHGHAWDTEEHTRAAARTCTHLCMCACVCSCVKGL